MSWNCIQVNWFYEEFMKFPENMSPALKLRFRWTKRLRSGLSTFAVALETKSKSWSGLKTPKLPKASKAFKPHKHPKIQKVIFAKRQENESKSSLNAKIQKAIFAKRSGTKSKSWHHFIKFHNTFFKFCFQRLLWVDHCNWIPQTSSTRRVS